jgi:hypothetical protein
MSSAKVAAAGGLVAFALAGCGIAAKPLAGTTQLGSSHGNHARLDDARHEHYECLKRAGLPVTTFTAHNGDPGLQIGALPAGPTIIFLTTPGAAQYAQIEGQAQAAEVIGSEQVYPNQASDTEMQQVEACAALGVTG